VHFKPGGGFLFFGLPASELRNTHVSLDALWGPGADDLRDALLEARSLQASFAILEASLRRRLACPGGPGARRSPHPAVAHALHAFSCGPRRQTVGEVIAGIGLSQRRFIQLFNEEVGLTPKLFWRVRRFQQVLRRLHQSACVEWARVAIDCGYFDQAHFIHDFQDFSGLNPTGYLIRRSEYLNHIPLPD
jgi:methylphosphotriester-DNA--protein-cysteine methyltransferase